MREVWGRCAPRPAGSETRPIATCSIRSCCIFTVAAFVSGAGWNRPDAKSPNFWGACGWSPSSEWRRPIFVGGGCATGRLRLDFFIKLGAPPPPPTPPPPPPRLSLNVPPKPESGTGCTMKTE